MGEVVAEFCNSEKIGPSKILELYSMMKFDAMHNRAFEWVFKPPKDMRTRQFCVHIISGLIEIPRNGLLETIVRRPHCRALAL